jgi:hypothetical protein
MERNWRNMVATQQEREWNATQQQLALSAADHTQRSAGVAYIVDEKCTFAAVNGKTEILLCGAEVSVIRGEQVSWIGERGCMSSELPTAELDRLISSECLAVYE